MPIEGDCLLIPCVGGPSPSRLVRHPAPLEIEERDGTYVLDERDAPGDRDPVYVYVFVPR